MSKIEVDYVRIAGLVSLVKDIHTTLPMYQALAASAAAELKEVNDALEKEARERRFTEAQQPITATDAEENAETVEDEANEEEVVDEQPTQIDRRL